MTLYLDLSLSPDQPLALSLRETRRKLGPAKGCVVGLGSKNAEFGPWKRKKARYTATSNYGPGGRLAQEAGVPEIVLRLLNYLPLLGGG